MPWKWSTLSGALFPCRRPVSQAKLNESTTDGCRHPQRPGPQ
jgi:hypothetical protein